MTHRAIIFDCFGVLATGTWQRFLDQLPADIDRQSLHDINRAHDAGMVSDDEYLRRLKDVTGHAPQRIEDVKSTELGKNTALLGYIRELHQSYTTGILSNIGSDWITTHLLDTEEQRLFDDIVESFRVGVTKPSAAIYMLAADRLHVSTQQCIFVDDNQDNVSGAQAVGMEGIAYQSLEQLKSDLTHLLRQT